MSTCELGYCNASCRFACCILELARNAKVEDNYSMLEVKDFLPRNVVDDASGDLGWDLAIGPKEE